MNIIPHLWFDKEAKEATQWYVSIFPQSKIDSINTIKDTPSGDCDIVNFTLFGKPFSAISAGPYFKINPSISFFVTYTNEQEMDTAWNTLHDGGKVLMEYMPYPFAQKFGWVEDKYGVSWQLCMRTEDTISMIAPCLLFTGRVAGKAKEAMDLYTSIFPNSKIETISEYVEGDYDKVGMVKHARFTLGDSICMAMDSSLPHQFNFNEAISFIVKCEDQQTIDAYWEKLSAVPEAEQCGWLKDKFGVSWQIVPTAMDTMMQEGTPEQKMRVTQAFLKMKKFNIDVLTQAYEGN